MYLDPKQFQGDMSYHERMHLFWKDIIRVKNPLTEDFKLKYDSIFHTFKAGQTKDVERYLAVRFCQQICQIIIGQMIVERGEKAKEEMAKTNGNLLVDKYLENRQVWDKMPRLDDKELNKKVWSDIWLGVVEKYGEDRDVDVHRPGNLNPNTTLYEELADDFKNIKVGEPTAPVVSEPTPETTSVSDVSMASEVTINDSPASS